ncbi:MAG: zinc ribbon domain-containing protein [Candidatus Odinarchaeota archaeon]|nr:zinc ribbon domain-containing protein [Candidatus Odinarchaeota archaeon]
MSSAIICPNCGRSIIVGSKFCPYCSINLEGIAQSRVATPLPKMVAIDLNATVLVLYLLYIS